MPEEHSKLIAAIPFRDSEDLAENLLKFQTRENVCAVILVINHIAPNKFNATDDLIEILKNFPVPLIAAVMGDLPEKAFWLLENSHLCVAAESSGATEAFEKGLINKIVPTDDVFREAFNLAEKICELAPLAIRACLKAVNQGFQMSLADGLKLEAGLFAALFATEDMREGTRAFLEKRSPNFQGK